MPVPFDPALPTRRSMASSGMSESIDASPVSVKVRAVGSQKIRDMLISGSVLGGSGATRRRVRMTARRSFAEAAPRARSMSCGSETNSCIFTPGIRTSANPTPGRLAVFPAWLRLVPSMVMRRVWKVVEGKVSVWPSPDKERDAGPRDTCTVFLPSKVRVALVIQRVSEPVMT